MRKIPGWESSIYILYSKLFSVALELRNLSDFLQMRSTLPQLLPTQVDEFAKIVQKPPKRDKNLPQNITIV